MPLIDAGKKAPAFTLPDQDGKKHALKDLAGKPVVLYFYPKDDTSGCTLQVALPDGTSRVHPQMAPPDDPPSWHLQMTLQVHLPDDTSRCTLQHAVEMYVRETPCHLRAALVPPLEFAVIAKFVICFRT